jgi:ribonuclease P protein component
VSVLRFIKKAKLIKTDEFSSVFNFRKRIFANFLAFHYQPNDLHRARLGLVVGKKIAKHAVDRNYMRRVLREFFRVQQHAISHVDLVIRVQKRFEKKDFIQIKQEFDTLITKLNQRTQQQTQLMQSQLIASVIDNHKIADTISDNT